MAAPQPIKKNDTLAGWPPLRFQRSQSLSFSGFFCVQQAEIQRAVRNPNLLTATMTCSQRRFSPSNCFFHAQYTYGIAGAAFPKSLAWGRRGGGIA